ncbi:hypothetical protein RKD48_002537 [Streptomyces ambofaciens]
MADDDAGQHGQGPADGAGREEGVSVAERPVETGAQDEGGGRDDGPGQRGPGQVPFTVRVGRTVEVSVGVEVSLGMAGGLRHAGARRGMRDATIALPEPPAHVPRVRHATQAQP